MDTEKYYTPIIDEFYVGFEYQSHEFSRDELGVKENNYDLWVDNVVDLNKLNFISTYPHCVYGLRIKYLNKEDIESLGFKLFNGLDVFEIDIEKYRKRDNLKCHIILRDTILILIGDKETPWSDWNVIFTGIIRNKSELVTLLKQLEIL